MYLGGSKSRFSIEPYERFCPKGSTAEEGNPKPTCKTLRPHYGRDFTRSGGGTLRAPVVAALGGTVTTGVGGASGNYITIDSPGGVRTVYMHLDSFDKATGDSVAAGELIGRVGETGRASGPHLHFEVFLSAPYVNGKQIEPETWLRDTPGAFFPIGVTPDRVPK